MRANTGGHAVVLPCPQCARTWSTEQTLAGHLMDAHGMAPSPAVARAMQVAHEILDKRYPKVGAPSNGGDAHEPQETPAEAEERAMGAMICSYCKHSGHVYRQCDKAAAHRALTKGKRVTCKDPKAAASRNGFAGALAALRVERGELDQAIAALERLEARGR